MAKTAEKYFAEGNEAFVDENYLEAAECYSKAIECDENFADCYTKRSQAYLKVQKYKEAKLDTLKALELGSKNAKTFLRKGIACFNLGEYEEAKEAFLAGQTLDSNDESFKSWIEKCANTLNTLASDGDTSENTSGIQVIDVSKKKHDWYQTEAFVVITILLKQMKPENIRIDFSETTLSCTAKLPSGSDYSLELDLAHPIVPQQSLWRVYPSKIEVKLKKSEGIRWTNLEYEGEARKNVKQFNPGATSQTLSDVSYPSSCPLKKDWDKLVVDIKKEEADEKLEGEAALNQLFQKIYSEGSDEVKKAMNKSFLESGGTVLSTNWKEVGSKKVDIKPPDGMEWKDWHE